MALNFVVKTLFAVLFLGSEGQEYVTREPCKVRTQTFNATGHLTWQGDENYTSVCRNGQECPNEWDHRTKSVTFHDESPSPIRTDKTLVFCESPYCGKFPLCAERQWATVLVFNNVSSPRLRIVCRCSNGFRSVQYAGEDWISGSSRIESHRLYRCDIPACREDQQCMIDDHMNGPQHDDHRNGSLLVRRVRRLCNCIQGQKCTFTETSGTERIYKCRNP